jgi:dolichol-phosphate mannosyltransferase
MPAPLSKVSVVIPARNEAGSLPSALGHLSATLRSRSISHEIIVVDDGSTDGTWALLEGLRAATPELVPVRNDGPNGYGRAVIRGLDAMTGDAAIVMMADESDSPEDALVYWEKLNEGWDCVFGSRFVAGGKTIGYPRFKFVMNRAVNFGIRVLFGISLNDTTNAFKAYSREAIDGCRPLIAPHFNLTVELPLKAIVRGFTWTVVPISWRNRKSGVAKLKLKEMGSRYLFIILYVWLEKYFSRGDYRRPPGASSPRKQA